MRSCRAHSSSASGEGGGTGRAVALALAMFAAGPSGVAWRGYPPRVTARVAGAQELVERVTRDQQPAAELQGGDLATPRSVVASRSPHPQQLSRLLDRQCETLSHPPWSLV